MHSYNFLILALLCATQLYSTNRLKPKDFPHLIWNPTQEHANTFGICSSAWTASMGKSWQHWITLHSCTGQNRTLSAYQKGGNRRHAVSRTLERCCSMLVFYLQWEYEFLSAGSGYERAVIFLCSFIPFSFCTLSIGHICHILMN